MSSTSPNLAASYLPKTDPAKFKDQVVVVTGAASGIGRKTAEHFAAQGAQVILIDINEEGLAEVQSSIREVGLKALSWRCDISDETDVAETINGLIARYGKIDILANLAGIYGFEALAEFSSELYHRHMNINVNGSFFLTRAVLPHMQKAKPKARSFSIRHVQSGGVGLVRSAAVEAGEGITVNAVMPGLIDTEQMRAVDGFEDLSKMVIGNQAVKRQGRTIDIAHAISFIASPEASFFSGQVFNCSGGETFSF